MRSLLVAVPLLVITACVGPAVPPPPPVAATPVPRPAPPPMTAAGSDWRDWPLTPGDWTYHQPEFGRSFAYFGRPDGWTVELACDARTRTVTLAIAGGPLAQPLTVRTSSVARTLPTVAVARADGNPSAAHRAQLAAGDPLLDAMGFSRGRFVIEQPGARPLVIPAWPEILRVTEDCRG